MGTLHCQAWISKMHKPLVSKCFRLLRKIFPRPLALLQLSVKLDNICRLETFKAAIWWAHCYSSSVLMVIRVSVWRVLSLSGADIAHGAFLRPITGHTPSEHNEAIFKLVKIFDRLFMTLHELASTTISLWEKTAGKLNCYCFVHLQFLQAIFQTFLLIAIAT